jgi:probable HAF family extracellular repeat protein
MQDLGTLGGANSSAHDINDHGQAVGYSEVASGENRAFLWRAGQMSDLGTLGSSASAASGINNLGQIVGGSKTTTGDNHAFMWSAADGMQDLGVLVGGTWSGAHDINVFTQVVGDSEATSAGYSWTHAFLWQAGAMQDLRYHAEGLPYNQANAINSCGQVVGASKADGENTAFLVTPEDSNGDGSPDLWYRDSNGDGLNDLGQDIGTLVESEVAHGINDLGEAVGIAYSSDGGGNLHAFLRTQVGAQLDLGTLGGTHSQAFDINRWREAVGDSTTAAGVRHAVLFRIGPFLPTPVGSNVSLRFRPLNTSVPVSVVFDQVTEAGATEYSSSNSGPLPPTGFRLNDPPSYFDVTTTSGFTGSVNICANYSDVNFTDEGALALFHYEDTDSDGTADAWVDRTVSRDPDTDIICASTSTLSTFAIFEAESQPPPNGSCPFRVAVRGTALVEELDYLRAFRDQHLVTSEFGRNLVELYYQHGPAIADVLDRNESLRTVVRWALMPVIEMTKLVVETEGETGLVVPQLGGLPR